MLFGDPSGATISTDYLITSTVSGQSLEKHNIVQYMQYNHNCPGWQYSGIYQHLQNGINFHDGGMGMHNDEQIPLKQRRLHHGCSIEPRSHVPMAPCQSTLLNEFQISMQCHSPTSVRTARSTWHRISCPAQAFRQWRHPWETDASVEMLQVCF